MHTVELLEHALAAIRALDIEVREELLGGAGSGYCEIQGHRTLFLDLSDEHAEHLAQALNAISSVSGRDELELIPELSRLLDTRRAA